MREWIHPYWIVAAVVIGVPTIGFYYYVVAPIICGITAGCGSASW